MVVIKDGRRPYTDIVTSWKEHELWYQIVFFLNILFM